MNRKDNKFVIDYAYSDIETEEIKSINLEVTVVNDKMQLLIKSQEMISKPQMEEILNDLQKTTFKKLKISLADDCDILFVADEETYNILITDKAIKINEIVKI